MSDQPRSGPPRPTEVNGRHREAPLAAERARHVLHEAHRLMEAARRYAYEGRAIVGQVRRSAAKKKPE